MQNSSRPSAFYLQILAPISRVYRHDTLSDAVRLQGQLSEGFQSEGPVWSVALSLNGFVPVSSDFWGEVPSLVSFWCHLQYEESALELRLWMAPPCRQSMKPVVEDAGATQPSLWDLDTSIMGLPLTGFSQ